MMLKGAEYNEKALLLLRYALEKRGVPEQAYFIGNEGDERSQSDRLCLLKSQAGYWIVLYTERGNVSQMVLHSSIRDAAVDFFWKLTRRDTPWDYRAEWEAETGQTF